MNKRPETQVAAEAAYRSKFEQVLIRLTPAEAAKADKQRGDLSRAEWMKQRAFAAPKKKARGK